MVLLLPCCLSTYIIVCIRCWWKNVLLRVPAGSGPLTYLLASPPRSLAHLFQPNVFFGKEQADAAPVAVRGSDALLEKRRADKILIARMLDMDEPFMTEKVW